MSISSEITRISNNVQNTIDTIGATGVTVPDGANSDNLPSLAQALANTKQDKLTGTQGQVVGFDSQGNAVAQNGAAQLTITLSASSWTSSGTRYQQTATVSGVTADSIVFADPSLTVGDNSNVLSAWSGIALYPATQGAGTLTFYTDAQPTVDVPVNVVVM